MEWFVAIGDQLEIVYILGYPSHGSGWVGLNKKDRVKVHVYPDSQGVRLVVLAEDIAKLGVGDFNLCAHGAGWKLIGVVHIRNSYHEEVL